MKKNLIIATLLLVSIGFSFATSLEVYGLYGFESSKASEVKVHSVGGGISLSTVDPGEFVGFFTNMNFLYAMQAEWGSLKSKDIDRPISADILLGARINPKLLFLTFPIDIGAHVAVNWRELGSTALRLGIGGTAGVKANFGKFGIFARAQIAYDFIQWNFGSGTPSHNPKSFSLIPQVGLSFSY